MNWFVVVRGRHLPVLHIVEVARESLCDERGVARHATHRLCAPDAIVPVSAVVLLRLPKPDIGALIGGGSVCRSCARAWQEAQAATAPAQSPGGSLLDLLAPGEAS